MAINPNGSIKWESLYAVSAPAPLFFASPAIAADGTVFIADETLYAVNPDGSVKWNFTGAGDNSPSIGQYGVIYDGGQNGLYAIRPDGTLLWIFPKFILSSPTIDADGSVYATSPDGNLYANQRGWNSQMDISWNFRLFLSRHRFRRNDIRGEQ